MGTLNKVTVGIQDRYGDDGCGLEAGMRIKIQHTNGLFCETGPLPSFWHGETLELYRSKQEMGTCANLDFEVGVEHIRFWIFSNEDVCVKSVTLQFLTPKGRQVTFRACCGINHGNTISNSIVNQVKNQSRKFKLCLYRDKRRIRHTM